ncbi:hypothetical protein Goklo_004501, partial [Gossypium klotzschianum]|nr:hypothetical protein [Gossypium klotzschianum]
MASKAFLFNFFKLYSFVHPSVQSAAKQFFNQNQPLNETIYATFEAFRKVRINLLVQ